MSTGLHEQLLQNALAEVANDQETPTETCVRRNVMDFAQLCVSSSVVSISVTALLAIIILLIVRPPFVTAMEQDTQRPWRGTVRVCWFSLCMAVCITLLAATTLPLIVSWGATL